MRHPGIRIVRHPYIPKSELKIKQFYHAAYNVQRKFLP